MRTPHSSLNQKVWLWVSSSFSRVLLKSICFKESFGGFLLIKIYNLSHRSCLTSDLRSGDVLLNVTNSVWWSFSIKRAFRWGRSSMRRSSTKRRSSMRAQWGLSVVAFRRASLRKWWLHTPVRRICTQVGDSKESERFQVFDAISHFSFFNWRGGFTSFR